ncbi:ABC-2 type transporter family protein [Prunus dulcis]|uniref:ABC-2 type transporter family protein n=1 Tax=Prunus dulcis TaxID=3755 RepID=A0A4Y1RKR3_PRUDU|nr:ABC-2 type transporter family protein [Prunus dulcis]
MFSGSARSHSIQKIEQGMAEQGLEGSQPVDLKKHPSGIVRTISGYQALRSAYDISPDKNSKWQIY